MQAVREQQYKNEMQNYRSGYRSSLPNYQVRRARQ